MNTLIARMKRLNIAKKLTYSFMIVALLPLAITALINYGNARSFLYEEANQKLAAIANSKAMLINNYIAERKKDVTELAQIPILIDGMTVLDAAFKSGLDTPEYRNAEKRIRPFLSRYQRNMAYFDTLLISTDGDVVFTVNESSELGTNLIRGQYRDTELARVFDEAKTLMQTEISDFKFYGPSNKPAAFIAAPIMDDGIITGAVAIQVNNEEIYAIVNEDKGMGMTGETVVATREKEGILIAAPLKNYPNAALKKLIPYDSKRTPPIELAIRGIKGFGLTEDFEKENVLAVWRYLPTIRWGMVVKINASEALAFTNTLRNNMILIGIVTVVLIVILISIISRGISDPIKKMASATHIIADGDLTQDIVIDSKDELGQMGQSLQTMVDSLREIVNRILTSGDRVTVSSEEYSAATQQMNATLETVSESFQNINRAVSTTVRQVEESRGAIDRMASTAKMVTGQAELASSESLKARDMAIEGGRSAETAITKMYLANASVENSVKLIKGLNERSNEIGEIVKIITGIADQTNLLALNAAIEAARAGEYGRGFAVVADEVKKLADMSARSAEKIASLIKTTQNETNDTVKAMDDGSTQVKDGMMAINETGVKLTDIVIKVKNTSETMESILESFGKMLEGTKLVEASMEGIFQGTQRTESSTQSAMASSEELSASMQEMASGARDLANMGAELGQAMKRFKL